MTETGAAGPKNLLKIDLGSNAKLKDWATRLPDGEKFTIEIEATKTGLTGDCLEASVLTIAPEGLEEDSPQPMDSKPGDEVTTNSEEAVQVLIGKGGY